MPHGGRVFLSDTFIYPIPLVYLVVERLFSSIGFKSSRPETELLVRTPNPRNFVRVPLNAYV